MHSIPEDMAFFRRMTLGKTVIMGNKTLKSFPGSKPLKGRKNIVLSKDTGLSIKGANICHSLPEILKIAAVCTPDDIFVIGGQSIYEQLLPYCSAAYITKFTSQTIKEADRFFPNLDLLPNWEPAERSGENIYNEYTYTFYKYINKSPLQLID